MLNWACGSMVEHCIRIAEIRVRFSVSPHYDIILFMLILLDKKATADQIEQASADLQGYIKFVVDTKNKVMSAGGKRHVEGEELLLKNGSKQEDLWGGGYDRQTREIDFDSMINIRPTHNPSREILNSSLRTAVEQIVRSFLE